MLKDVFSRVCWPKKMLNRIFEFTIRRSSTTGGQRVSLSVNKSWKPFFGLYLLRGVLKKKGLKCKTKFFLIKNMDNLFLLEIMAGKQNFNQCLFNYVLSDKNFKVDPRTISQVSGHSRIMECWDGQLPKNHIFPHYRFVRSYDNLIRSLQFIRYRFEHRVCQHRLGCREVLLICSHWQCGMQFWGFSTLA